MDDRKLICKRLEKAKEKEPSYSGIIFRGVANKFGGYNNFAEFGEIITPRKRNERLTLDDIIRAADNYEIDSPEAIILLQYRRQKGMIIKYYSDNKLDCSLYLIGELNPHDDHFDLIL